ncbi:MAG: hypothetical protein KAI66_17875 [Lentisphaeria bacterium]|nr:hypothetical protein [Lentisphaeria bacterium]
MENWKTFWTVFCGIGAVSFALLIIVVVPLGGIELKQFFRSLSGEKNPGTQD